MTSPRDHKLSLSEHYRRQVVPTLQQELGLKNALSVPRLVKVVINIGLGQQAQEGKLSEVAIKTLNRITGQKPILTKAKKSISNFKIREGMVVGAMVTLRRDRMYDFLDKLVHVALPRMRDFHGLDPKKGFDDNGNYSLGFREHIVFPEIRSDEIESVHGLEIA